MNVKNSGRRIVSKEEYLARLGRKAALRFGSVSLLGSGCFVFLMAVCCLCIGILLWSESALLGLLWLAGFCVVLFLAFVAFHVGARYMETASKIDTGIPLTHANISELAAPESLVRASEEPVQEQQSVLLRAAAERQEQHVEQLVRAAGEPE